MWRTFLLAVCAAPATALPFGFGRRKGAVLASLHEIAAGSDHSTKVFSFAVHANAAATGPMDERVVSRTGGGNVDGDDESKTMTLEDFISFDNPGKVNGPGLATLNTPALTTTVQNTVDTSSTGETPQTVGV